MKSSLWIVAVLWACISCGSGTTRIEPSASAACTCPTTQKFDGSNCVASADFTAPVGCTDDGTAVCGCDSENYATTCAATNLGVQVAFVGACPAPQAPSGFGW